MRTFFVRLAAIVLIGISSAPLQAAGVRFDGIVFESGAGTVRRPLAGATIRISPGNFETRTNNAGGFIFSDIPASAYRVTVTAPGHSDLTQDIAITTNTTRTFVLPIVSSQVYLLSGMVSERDRSGIIRPLAGAVVHVIGTDFSTRTDANGGYAIASLPPGSYTVEATAAGHQRARLQVNMNSNVTLNFTLPVTSTTPSAGNVTVRGTISASGGRVAGATVRLTPGNYTATTGADGRFAIDGVPAGTYMVHVKAAGYRAVNRRVAIAADRSIDISLAAKTQKGRGNGDRDDDDRGGKGRGKGHGHGHDD